MDLEIKTVAVNPQARDVAIVFYTSDTKDAAEVHLSVRVLRDNMLSIQFRVANSRGQGGSAADHSRAIAMISQLFAEAEKKMMSVYQYVNAIALGELQRAKEEAE